MRPKFKVEDSPLTVRDIARLARVSIATVSRVVNGGSNVTPERRRSVEEAIRQTGFTPNAAAVRMAGLSALKRRDRHEAREKPKWTVVSGDC